MKKHTQKKIRFQYMEHPDVIEHLNKKPFHLKSDWVRKATRSLMAKEKKLSTR